MTATPPPTEPLLLALTDHLQHHCSCRSGGERCAACDLRVLVRTTREELIAWRARSARLDVDRRDALANGRDHLRAHATSCEQCALLTTLIGGELRPVSDR